MQRSRVKMDYGVAEEEIASFLNSRFADYGAEGRCIAAPMPDNDAEMSEFNNRLDMGRVAVQYIDSNYEPDKGLDAARVEERVRFRLAFVSTRLRKEYGVYWLMAFAKKHLTGFKPSDADRLTVIKYEPVSFDQNNIQHSLEFECRTMISDYIESMPDWEKPIGGPITSVGFVEEFGEVA